MKSLVIVGLQWGDEGKGKMVDFLSEHFEIVVRFQGGPNAGHTVKIGDGVYKFRIMPSGAVRGATAVIGNGVVIDPEVLIQEIEHLKGRGIDVSLKISERAHVITPYDRVIDGLQEEARGASKVGTTLRGIGPAYSHKSARVGMRICDLVGPIERGQWEHYASTCQREIRSMSMKGDDESLCSALDRSRELIERIHGCITDTGDYLVSAMAAGKRVLFEGAQGTLLDVDHGTYPYVTSSNCVSSAASTGTGVPFTMLGSVLGVFKSYSTRVGTGPFPTELSDDTGRLIQQRGGEYGTVTGRPRRCGWLDLVALAYAVRLNGAKYLAMTKADVLSGLDTVRVCIAYNVDGSETRRIPARVVDYEKVVPVYQDLEGWHLDTPSAPDLRRHAADMLPAALLDYIALIERSVSSRVSIVSLGPERSETVILDTALVPGG